MSEETKPGVRVFSIKAAHMQISDNCRKVHGGDEQAFDVAVEKLREVYLDTVKAWPVGKDARFNLVLSVEYER